MTRERRHSAVEVASATPPDEAERMRLLVEHAPTAMAMVDRELRYLAVNGQWLRLHGLGADVVGRRHDELLPSLPERWRDIYRRCLDGAVEHADADAWPRADGTVDWVRWRVQPWRHGDGAIGGLVLFSELVTERVHGELERARIADDLREENRANDTLKRIGLSLSSELDLDRLVQLLTDEATALCCAELGAFFYNVTDARGERYMLYALSGVPRERFAGLPMPRNTGVFGPTFRGEGVVRSSDITKDPRYGHNPPHHGMPAGHVPVRSYLAVPVVSRSGEVFGGLFFGHSQPGIFGERDERLIVAVAAQAAIAFDNARLYTEAKTARAQAEASQARLRFVAEASALLAESLDYEVTLRRVAELAVPRIADWCTVTVRDDTGRLRRVAAAHKDPSCRRLMEEYERNWPPSAHRSGSLMAAVGGGSVLQPEVSDADLAAAAQNEAHLALLRSIGCTSCMMVPIAARGETLGAISLMIADGTRRFGPEDLAAAEELARRAALAIENAQLYRDARRRQEAVGFIAEASAILGSSLDYQATLQSLANVVVPRFGDWCSVGVIEGGVLRPVAMAHVDPSRVALAQEMQRRWPTQVDGPGAIAEVLRSGRALLVEQISDAALTAGAGDAERLRRLRELGLRSILIVPLTARGRSLGALTLCWAESDRRYGADDLPLIEELGRRAGLAIDNARLYDEAQRAIRVRDEFLAIASHELKTPLTSMQLQVSGLLRNLALGRHGELEPERLKRRLEGVDRQVERLTTLIEALLDVSRASAGRLQLELTEVRLAAVVRQALLRLDADLRAAGCATELSLDEGVVGRWDRLRLEQIVTNFVSNALKYGAGKPIEIGVAGDGARARLWVRDHGIGIAEADRARIFDRFERAVSPEHFGGLGLGLWIVRICVEAMDGTVRVDSEPGRGSTFTVELPLKRAG